MSTEENEAATDPVEDKDELEIAREASELAEADEVVETPAEADDVVEMGGSDDEAESPEVSDEQDANDWGDVAPPPEDTVPKAPEAPPTEEEKEGDDTENYDDFDGEKHVDEYTRSFSGRGEKPIKDDEEPDFAKYRTNVAERIYKARKAAANKEPTASPNLVKHAQEYQDWRASMALLNRNIAEYATAMKVLSEKRNQLFEHYAELSKGTPLFDRIGKPLTKDELANFEHVGDIKTPEGIAERTKAIMQTSEDIGPGSFWAYQQLSMLQEELNVLDFKNHTAKYVDEWDDVVTSQLDSDAITVRLLSKDKEKYTGKVETLRNKVNKIEHKGKQVAPKKLSDKLIRNEKKLADYDAQYEEKANGVSVAFYEATERGWVDLYPLMKNVMKFEINRLGRESSCYGSFHSTLAALKNDYREATKDTPDHPNAGSKL